MSKCRYQFEEVKSVIDSKSFVMTNSMEKELAVVMKITAKENDVNDFLHIFRLFLLPSSVQLLIAVASLSSSFQI